MYFVGLALCGVTTDVQADAWAHYYVDNFASIAANIRCWERICAALAECSGLRIGIGCSALAGIAASFGVFAVACLQTLAVTVRVFSILVAPKDPNN